LGKEKGRDNNGNEKEKEKVKMSESDVRRWGSKKMKKKDADFFYFRCGTLSSR
jgi:hypothetical protein